MRAWAESAPHLSSLLQILVHARPLERVPTNDPQPAAGSPELPAVRGRFEKRKLTKLPEHHALVTFICNFPFLNFSETVGGRPQLPAGGAYVTLCF